MCKRQWEVKRLERKTPAIQGVSSLQILESQSLEKKVEDYLENPSALLYRWRLNYSITPVVNYRGNSQTDVFWLKEGLCLSILFLTTKRLLHPWIPEACMVWKAGVVVISQKHTHPLPHSMYTVASTHLEVWTRSHTYVIFTISVWGKNWHSACKPEKLSGVLNNPF